MAIEGLDEEGPILGEDLNGLNLEGSIEDGFLEGVESTLEQCQDDETVAEEELVQEVTEDFVEES